jgi:hypothetical protein
MAVIVNKNTTQSAAADSSGVVLTGSTGVQSIRMIPACRVYIKAVDSTTAAPVQTYTVKSNGATPTGWTDLGTMVGPAKVAYSKELTKVKTGIDQITRYTYVSAKTAELEFNLSQFDDLVMAAISGLTASVITSGSIVSFGLGQEDIVEKAILMVAQNKLDGKEHQFYNPSAKIEFEIDEVENGWAMKVMAELIAFTAVGQTKEELIRHTILT